MLAHEHDTIRIKSIHSTFLRLCGLTFLLDIGKAELGEP